MIGKLKKLKGRSLAEVKDRGRQSVSAWAERFGLSSQAKLPTDAEFFRLFSLPFENVTPEKLFDYYRRRNTTNFYASFDDVEETTREFRRRFPAREAEIVRAADRLGEGYFDLLGFENLSFGGRIPDWHFDPLSEKTSPRIHWAAIDLENPAATGDKKIIWELNRHQYFTTLGQAYRLTKDEKYAEIFVAHLGSWCAENPPKIGVNWLSSLELAFRAISWIWAVRFFRDSPRLTPDVFLLMLKYLYLHGRHLETYLSTYFSPNTHLTGEALGLYYLGTFFPELEPSRRWKDLGYRILLDALDFQVRSDGVYCEQSTHYHRYTTDFYANLLILRRREGAEIDASHLEKTEQLFDFLLYTAAPSGATPLIGDDDGGRWFFLDERPITDYRPTLALGATLFERGDLKYVAGEASAELLWLLGPDGIRKFDEIEPFRPRETSKAFAVSGFFVMREAWRRDADYLLIDCGEHGFLNGGHAHADALSFVFEAAGEPVFVDSGTFNYTSDAAARRLFRSAAAHNCLTVNGESSSVPHTAFSWRTTARSNLLEWSVEEGETRFRGTHDGFRRLGVAYEREIRLQNEGTLELRDVISSESENSYELNFILAPGLNVSVENGFVVINFGKREAIESLTMKTECHVDGNKTSGSWAIEPFFVSPRYGAKVETKRLIYTVRAKGLLKISNILRKTVK